MFLLGIMFVMRLQPVFIVRVLIVITFFYSLIIYNSMGTFWFRYILLIVMLRGVLVVFTYIVTIVPNESFEIYNLVIVFFFIILLIVECMDLFNLDFRVVTVNLWGNYIGMIVLFLVGFLLRVMLLVVSLRYINDGAFRVK